MTASELQAATVEVLALRRYSVGVALVLLLTTLLTTLERWQVLNVFTRFEFFRHSQHRTWLPLGL